jgi:hypothetical protein
MAFETVAGSKTYVKLDELKEGDLAIDNGSYIGVENNQFGGQNLVFSTEKGLVAITKGKLLGDLVDDGTFTEGDRYNVIFEGKKNTKGGDRSYSTFTIQRDRQVAASSGNDTAPPASMEMASDLTL